VPAPQTINTLLLHGCGWDDDSFSTLAAALPTLVCCSALVHLNVAGNRIGDVGMTALADALGVRSIMSMQHGILISQLIMLCALCVVL
jgi:hypothetical protein